MQIEQTNGRDTATFERREHMVIEPPLVAGGQGRRPDEITSTVTVAAWLALTLLQAGAVVCGIGVINAVAGHLVAGIAALCCVVVGCVAYGAGKASAS